MKTLSKTLSIVFLLVISILLSSCGEKKDPPPNNVDTSGNTSGTTGSTKPVFTKKELLKSFENCNPDSANCSHIKINYVEVSGPPTSELMNKYINNFLLNMYSMGDTGEVVYGSLDAMAAGFLNDYESAKKEFPDMPGEWYLGATFTDTAGTDSIISFKQSYDMFTGGAHPVYYEFYYNFNPNTGDTLALSDIFKPGFENELKTLVVNKFRKDQNLGPNDPLTKAGLFEDTLSYNQNYLITREGINFHYNIYEVWSYAQGTLDIFISYADLKGILKTGGIY